MNSMDRIKEVIVVEGRDDIDAVGKAVDADIVATHGFGIAKETWDVLESAYEKKGLIIFTDPDHAGEGIRKRLTERFPDSKQAYLDRPSAEKKGDIGIENASPEDIREALSKAHASVCEDDGPGYTNADMKAWHLVGAADAASRRERLGKALGIGNANAKAFLRKLNGFGIGRDEIEEAVRKIEADI